MIIPPEKLSDLVLQNIMEEFILRDGTDYGQDELGLKEKVDALKSQIQREDVLIVFDQDTESVTLITKLDYLRNNS